MNVLRINYVVAHVFIGAAPLLIGLFVYLNDRKSELSKKFLIYNLSISWWGLFTVLMELATTNSMALFWDRISLIAIVFIPTAYLDFTLTFIKQTNTKSILRISYTTSAFFAFFSWTPLMAKSVSSKLFVRNFTDPGVL